MQGQAQALETDGQESNEAAQKALVFLPGWESEEGRPHVLRSEEGDGEEKGIRGVAGGLSWTDTLACA